MPSPLEPMHVRDLRNTPQRLAWAMSLGSVLWLPHQVAAERLPAWSTGPLLGFVTGTGTSAKALGQGWTWGWYGAFHPTRTERRVNIGLKWTVQFPRFGDFSTTTASAVTASPRLVLGDLGASLRFSPTDRGRWYLTAGGGVALVRANTPLPPDLQRAWLTSFATLGVEYFLGASSLITTDVRLSGFDGSPAMFGLQITVGFAN